MKKLVLLLVLIVCAGIAYYIYVDTKPPHIDLGIAEKAQINHPLTIKISDDRALNKVCYTLSGGNCSGAERCQSNIRSDSFALQVEPDTCLPNNEPLDITVSVKAVDASLIPNQTEATATFTYDTQPPNVITLGGTRYLKRGGSGVVLYEVGEPPAATGIVLDDLKFRAFPYDQNRFLSFYAHPYFIKADDFKPRIFAEDAAGNQRKVRPGSATASRSFKSEKIVLTDAFLDIVKDKMMATAASSPLEAFLYVNDTMRQENYRTIVEACSDTQPEQLWEGAFLRNQGATKAGFADSRTYVYGSEAVSQQVHTGIDIAGINNSEIVASNHGRVVFTGEIGIYGNVVIIDHGYGIHSLYGHLSQITVNVGDLVQKGDPIAISGETGLVFGDHLHFEIRVNGFPVNPIEWFDGDWIKSHIEPTMAKVRSIN
ncbi:MAG: M23 family metallopeptidase [Desulfuromonadales bacterium]